MPKTFAQDFCLGPRDTLEEKYSNKLVALPFQTKGEVGCEALSSYSRPGSSGNTATPQRSSSMKQPCDNGRGMRNSFKRPQRCHAASKRKARSEGPRPRGPSGALNFTRLRGKSTSALHFHLAQATWNMKFTFLGTSLRQVKSVRTAQPVYHLSSCLQNLKLQISI